MIVKSEKLRWLAAGGVWMKSSLMALLLFAVGGVRAADPTISITATPRYPWNGKVDLRFTIDGTSGTKYDTSFTAKDVAGGTNLTMKTFYKSNGTAANVGKEALLPGTYNWVWDAEEDLTHRWATYSGCLPTNSAVLFSNVQLSELTEFYAVPCGRAVSDNSNLAKGAYIKDDGVGKTMQFAFSDDVFTKCVCVHLEQSGPDVVGYAKWARYVSGTGQEQSDFDDISAKTMSVATSETESGYGLLKLEAKGAKLDSSPVLERVVVVGNMAMSAFIYTIKFNANGGTGTMDDEPLAYGIGKALTANAFTRTGYTFQGWATSASGAKVYTDKQSVSNLTATAGATVNLYAAWKANTYSVKFNANGGTGTMSNESFTYGTAKALTANAFTRTGYAFEGWATSASGSKVYSDKQSVNNLTATAGGTVNLYAVWKNSNPLYMVIDLSGGSSATSYPVTYLDAVPSGGWTDTYKTTKLVLRRCDAGSFIMGGDQANSAHNVTLTKPYYIGVFEVTQKQYTLVMGSCPSSLGDAFPAYNVSYNSIRGTSNGAKWPSSSAVDSSSFMGKLRTRTGMNFDLPTEAQWERSCRAGTTTKYYWGSSIDGDYLWYFDNSATAGRKQPHTCGTKKANAWGLYDMSGNVHEWCLDYYGTMPYGTDPKGPSKGDDAGRRVVRGGSYNSSEPYVTSYDRTRVRPGHPDDTYVCGFRLFLPLQ